MKVADLKSLLQQAAVQFDSKATKPALIKKILESPAALAVAAEDNAGADDDLPDLPPSINWDDAPQALAAATPAVQQKPPAAAAPPLKVPPPTPATGVSAPTAPVQSGGATQDATQKETPLFKADIPVLTVEDEAAKRKARANKWGTTFVDPTAAPPPKVEATPKGSSGASAEDESRRKAREARFGLSTSKPATAVAPVDEEEVRKRKAREEKFGANKKPRLDDGQAN